MAAIDLFQDSDASLTSPIENVEDVNPNNSEDISHVSRQLYIGTSGSLKVTMKGGETVTLNSVTAGTFLDWRVSRVWADSTASNIVAGW